MSDRIARILLGIVTGLVLLVALAADLPRLADGRFWSDAASYHAMASSLAFDHDLEFGPEDLARERASYPAGPQGVFLKRVPAPGGGKRLVYAKPLLYPAVAAPLVRLLGADRALLLLNGLVFAAVVWLGTGLVSGRGPSAAGVVGALTVVLAGATPAYLLWPTPEIFNLGLATAGLFCWRRGHPLLAAVFLGAATYAKPTNAALALPLLCDPWFEASWGGWVGRARECARRVAVVALVVATGFGINRLVTGELNYQGGERKTFYDRYPFDPGVTFDTTGVWMTTDHVGPLVQGRDEGEQSIRVAPPRSSDELRQALARNLVYFWIGRFGGALPYFPGVGMALLLFLLLGPRERAGWLALLALLVSWIGYVVLIPDNWYGGAGTIGNRYFLNLVPLGFLLLPRGRWPWAALGAWPVTAALLGPVLASPVHHSLHPGEHATWPTFRELPAELTMLGDLSVFTDVWRKRRPFNAPGGDPSRRAPGEPPSYFLWFLDDGTFGQESSFEHEGFWLRGGQGAEVVVQTLGRAARLRLLVTSGPKGDIVTARLGGQRRQLVLPPLRTQELALDAGDTSVSYYGTRLYGLRLSSRYAGSAQGDGRLLGSFVRVVVEPE